MAFTHHVSEELEALSYWMSRLCILVRRLQLVATSSPRIERPLTHLVHRFRQLGHRIARMTSSLLRHLNSVICLGR
jgi:hypothetical protein